MFSSFRQSYSVRIKFISIVNTDMEFKMKAQKTIYYYLNKIYKKKSLIFIINCFCWLTQKRVVAAVNESH